MGYPRPGWRGPDRLVQLAKVGNDRKVEPQKGKRSSKSLKKREHKVKRFRQFKKGKEISREHAHDQPNRRALTRHHNETITSTKNVSKTKV